MWYWCKDKQVDQQNRSQCKPTSVESLSHLIIYKGANIIKKGKKSLKYWCWEHHTMNICKTKNFVATSCCTWKLLCDIDLNMNAK